MIKFWIDNARYNALPQSLLPAIVAIILALSSASFSWIYALAALIGVGLAHLSMNLFDDYFDYKIKGTTIREILDAGGVRARMDKCHYITSGKTTPKKLFWVALTLSLMASLLGGAIFIERGITILYIVLGAGILGIGYSAPPLKLSYWGLGELVIAIVFGPLLMSGVYYAACGAMSPQIWFIAIPIGLLVANIVYTHAIMDYEPDKRAKKMTLAVLLNTTNAKLAASILIMALSYITILAGCIAHFLPWYYMIVFATLPIAITLFYLLTMFIKYPQKNYQPQWWMQPMERWKAIKDAGIDWFMIRWFLARNLITQFCLIIILLALWKMI